MKASLLLAFTTFGAVIATKTSDFTPLDKRQSTDVPCSELNLKGCGDACIPLSYTCCPSGEGGCPATAYCDLISDGEYGCCPRGEVCVGGGGVQTSITTIYSTTQEEPTDYPEPEEPEPEEPEPEEPEPEEPEPEEPEPEEPEEPDTSVPPAPWPTPIPSNDTGIPTASPTGEEPPVATDAAAVNGFVATNLLGGLVAAAAVLL